MTRGTLIRFGLGYALLGILAACCIAAFVLGLVNNSGKASKASVVAISREVNPGAAAAYKAACDGATSSAAQAGLVLVSCKLVAPVNKQSTNPTLKGDEARVVLQVQESGGNYFIVEVLVSKAAYSPTGLQVVGQPSKAVKTLPTPTS